MQLQCLSRKAWVAATPEEIVRQTWLAQLNVQGFPSALISVEKGIVGKKIPIRRTDIVCFGKGAEGLFPLLLIECKAIPLNQKAVTQAIAYNHYVQARFVAVVNGNEIKFGYPSADGYQFVGYLPRFDELLKAVVAAD